jgi:(S)-ureidoglycine aminohydrolase
MEHGLVMLRGQALQPLGRDWHELREGDFVWMGLYPPQRIYATGNKVVEYLLYKDVNRDVTSPHERGRLTSHRGGGRRARRRIRP